MSSASTAPCATERKFVVKNPGFGVSGFDQTSHWQGRVKLATEEQILFDLIYGSEISAKGFERQYSNIRNQVLNRPELIIEIFALLKAHRETKEHSRLFPGFNALEKFESILIEFGKKYRARVQGIVESFIEIDVPDSSNVMTSHYFEIIARAIRQLDYCPPGYIDVLIAKLNSENLSGDELLLVSRALAHSGPGGVDVLVKTMIQFPRKDWSWALLELSVVFKDFQARFEELMPVALEQSYYQSHRWQASQSAISASFFGEKLQLALFERWENARTVPNGYQAVHVRDGVAVTLAAIGGIPKLIQDFGNTPLRILTIISTIKHLVNRHQDSHPDCPFWARIAYVPNLHYEFGWTIELAKSANLLFQRHALSLLCSFLSHPSCTDEQRAKAAEIIVGLPNTGIPVDRQLRLMVSLAILVRFSKRLEESKNSSSSNHELLNAFNCLVQVIKISNSMRDKYLRLVNPQARHEQEFEPQVNFENEIRYRKLLTEDEILKLESVNREYVGRHVYPIFQYLLQIYKQSVANDMELARLTVDQFEVSNT